VDCAALWGFVEQFRLSHTSLESFVLFLLLSISQPFYLALKAYLSSINTP
jgi:hypothetical protein